MMMLERLNFTPTLSEDLMHFEAHCDAHPVEAKEVFKCIAELRDSLSAFRSLAEQSAAATELQRTATCCEPAAVDSQSPVTADVLIVDARANE